MSLIGVIPARMESSRFPGKALAEINGIPMLGHVYHRSKMCELLDDLYVATCNKEIVDYVESIGGKAVMTSDKHVRACDRAAEAMLIIEEIRGERVDILAMIQGDEPMVLPEMIDEALNPLIQNKDELVCNLIAEVKTKEEHDDPNVVKVVADLDDYLLYYSRLPIPTCKEVPKEVKLLKQVGLILFRRDFLLRFNELEQTPLEIVESIDMIRGLENGYKVKAFCTDKDMFSVDNIEDLKGVEVAMRGDKLVALYR